ncbi:MAG: hypothetical protein Q7S57_05375 [bacterium]|nr:hypothetical protein [bacterium]
MGIVCCEHPDQGIVVETAPFVNPHQKTTTNIQRYNAFFEGVAVWGGQEWRTLSVAEIALFFREVAVDLRFAHQQRHDVVMREYNRHSRLTRWWKRLRGWKAPHISTQDEVVQEISVRCRNLSKMMTWKRSFPIYTDTGMDFLISKSKEVAEMLDAG